jgi:hypothetical protein
MAARLSEWLSLYTPSRSDTGTHDAAVLAGALVTGMLFVVPVVARLLRTHGGATDPVAAVVPFVIVCIVYGLLVHWRGRLPLGLFVAFAVFVTIWGPSLPWGPTRGTLAWTTTQNWLAGLALVGLLVYYTWHDWNPQEHFSRVHLVFGGFVVWIFVSIPFTAGPYPSFAFQFAIYMLQAWAVFAVVSWLSETGRLSLSAAAVTFAVVVIGHAGVGLAEFMQQISFRAAGTTEAAAVVSQLSVGPFGPHPMGPYVSGFVGSSALGSLLAMIAPLLCVLAFRTRSVWRFAWAASWLLLAFVLRVTAWDTGRGAFLLGTAVVGVGLVWHYRAKSCVSIGLARAGFATFTAVLGVAIVLLPSSIAGSSTRVTAVGTRVVNMDGRPLSTGIVVRALDTGITRVVSAVVDIARATNTTAGATNVSAGYGPEYLSPERAVSAVSSLSVPLFDLSGLGIRLRQVVAGIDLFFQYPIFGIGGANFYFVAEAFGLPKLWLHTVYVALLAETGLPGFLLYMIALGFVVMAGRRLLIHKGNRRNVDWYLALGLIAALCAHFGTMLFQPTHMRAQLLFPFWALCGLLVGTERRLRSSKWARQRDSN